MHIWDKSSSNVTSSTQCGHSRSASDAAAGRAEPAAGSGVHQSDVQLHQHRQVLAQSESVS
jgi:hypothetical protein